MNKIITTLIIALFASAAFAQTPTAPSTTDPKPPVAQQVAPQSENASAKPPLAASDTATKASTKGSIHKRHAHKAKRKAHQAKKESTAASSTPPNTVDAKAATPK